MELLSLRGEGPALKGFLTDKLTIKADSALFVMIRFLRRLSRHPVIRKDDDLRNFLESAGEVS